jgi:hypothetical protein
MQRLNILYIGRNEEIMNTVVRLIHKQENWTATGVLTDDDALKVWRSNTFDIVLLGNGIDPISEENLCGYFRSVKEDINIIQHYGGGSGLLYNEIMEALQTRCQPEPVEGLHTLGMFLDEKRFDGAHISTELNTPNPLSA